MIEAELDIEPRGGYLGLRLPPALARAARLRAGKRVRTTVEDGRVVITPYDGKRLTLADRLARFDPAEHGGEAMGCGPVGPGACSAGARG